MSKLLWTIILLLILSGLGRYLLFKDDGIKNISRPVEKEIVPARDWSEIDSAIVTSLKFARAEAEVLANEEIDSWTDDLIKRIDTKFLIWYFSYWNQQKMGLKGLWNSLLHSWDEEYPSAAEVLTMEVQEKFSEMVLRPQIAHRQMENIADDVVKKYAASLQQSLQEIPNKYYLSRHEWEIHISEIAIVTGATEGNRQTDLSLKTIYTAGVVGSVKLLAITKPMLTKMGSKVSAKLAAKSAVKLATKTGGKVAAKTGGKFLGAIVGVGIIIWDVYDHNETTKTQQPILRENLIDYLETLKYSLLHESKSGLITILIDIENRYIDAISKI